MKIVPCAVLATAFAVSTVASAEVSVLENNKTLTHDCAKDRVVDLIGNHIKITLIGTCARVSITGNHETVIGSATIVYVTGNNNNLTLEGADKITLAGNKNTLSWKQGAAKHLPKIVNVGKHNNVTQAK